MVGVKLESLFSSLKLPFSESVLNNTFVEYLRELYRGGWVVAIITKYSEDIARKACKKIPFHHYIITGYGAEIYDTFSSDVLYSTGIASRDCVEIIESSSTGATRCNVTLHGLHSTSQARYFTQAYSCNTFTSYLYYHELQANTSWIEIPQRECTDLHLLNNPALRAISHISLHGIESASSRTPNIPNATSIAYLHDVFARMEIVPHLTSKKRCLSSALLHLKDTLSINGRIVLVAGEKQDLMTVSSIDSVVVACIVDDTSVTKRCTEQPEKYIILPTTEINNVSSTIAAINKALGI